MSKNPIINAVCAISYILFIGGIMNFISQTHVDKPDTPFAPVLFLSLLTLSASIMAYIFFYKPLQLLTEGRKKEAMNLFLKTVGIFAIFTAFVLILLLTGVI